jgi:chromate transporter
MTYKQLFFTFFKFGLFTFGGGYAMIPMMRRVFVYDQKQIDEHTMTDYIAISQIAPGMIAINMANIIGRHLKGKKGSFVAVSGVSLPSFIIISLIAALIPNILDHPVVLKAVQGIVIAVIVLLCMTIVHLLNYLKRYWYLVMYAGIVTLAVFFFEVPIVLILLSAIILGSIQAYYLSKKEVPHG